jgi:predicted extracellular nuclease
MIIRCGTFNLYQFAAPPGAWYEEENFYSEPDWKSKKEWVKNQLINMNCDVVGVQEVFSPEELKELAAEIGYSYFSIVDTPKKESEYSSVYVSPVVAIISKHPIVTAVAVEFGDRSKENLPIQTEFNFSRTPIRAEIEIENVGNIVFYVAHLKSKRPKEIPLAFEPNDNWDQKVLKTMKARSTGNVAALLQRGAEASELYNHISNDLHKKPNTPVILLGDLNDDTNSIPIEALSNRSRIYEIDNTDYNDLPLEAKIAIYRYKMFDAFDMAPNPNGLPRTPTHYHKGEGGTLDYIFISNALNEKNSNSVGRISSYDVFDEHLKSDGVGNHKQSDHGQPVVTIQFS